MLVGVDATGVAIDADLTFDGAGWKGANFPVLSEYLATTAGWPSTSRLALAAGSGCTSDEPNTNVGETSQALAQQLAQLPRSTVVQPPNPCRRSATTPPTCGCGSTTTARRDQGYRVAETHRGSHGINYNVSPKDVVIDFWVVDLDGAPVVVDMWHDERRIERAAGPDRPDPGLDHLRDRRVGERRSWSAPIRRDR